jgi:hypothetical protein
VHELCSYDYAIVRVVPRVEREEFVNVGVIVSCPEKNFLDGRIEVDEPRLLALDPKLDLEAVKANLASIPLICGGTKDSGPIGQLTQRERFHWLVAPRSTIIQVSAVHTGRCSNPSIAVEHLLTAMVRKV